MAPLTPSEEQSRSSHLKEDSSVSNAMSSEDALYCDKKKVVATGKNISRWKAVVGSSSWRKHMQSRRKSLRKNSMSRNEPSIDTIEEDIIFDSHDDFNGIKEGEKETLKTKSTFEKQKENNSQNQYDTFEINSALSPNELSIVDSICKENTEEQQMRLEYEQSRHDIIDSIQVSERSLDDQDYEISSLENEIAEVIKKNGVDTDALIRKCQVLRNSEDKYHTDKTEFAAALNDNDKIRSEIRKVVEVRDSIGSDIANEINELLEMIKNVEEKNLCDNNRLQKLQKLNEKREKRLSLVQRKIMLIKKKEQRGIQKYFTNMF